MKSKRVRIIIDINDDTGRVSLDIIDLKGARVHMERVRPGDFTQWLPKGGSYKCRIVEVVMA